MGFSKPPQQVARLAVLFVVAGTALILARHFFVPPTFGEMGHYRTAAIDSTVARPIRFAGLQACAACHTEEMDMKGRSYHRGLSCEVCHGAAGDHAEDPSSRVPAARRERSACLNCHEYLPSRPTGFPQVRSANHNPMKPCITCHNPHDPTPQQAPGSCAACHATIENTKTFSSHASLECTICHEAPAEHKLDPRVFVAKKPATRDACGRCHSQDAAAAEDIPRVDLATHGDRYLCWQCHYPHDPER